MDMLQLKDFFFWGFILNYGILFLWFFILLIGKDWMYSIHSRIFDISKEQFAVVNYGFMGFYKLSIFMLFLIPFIVLKCIVQ